MKSLAVFVLFVSISLTAFAQTPKRRAKTPSKKTVAAQKLGDEKEEFDKAVALTDAAERIKALQKFVKNFPDSENRTRASELIVSTRAALGDEKFQAGDAAGGIELFKLAVKDAPQPISDKLFTEVVAQIPTNLFFRGERGAAIEIARAVEEKAAGNAKQILGLAAFYLNMENATEAERLARKAIEIDANLPAAYQTLGLAHRLNFQIEDAAADYEKAIELDANSVVSKRSLAEMKRAVGKPLEAVALYREILAKDETDNAARTGLILALFDADKQAEAETEMQKSLDAQPNNLFLLTGAAYWYAARNQGAKAVELAEKAIAAEPRYTWAHIALARGLVLEKRFADAEKTLLGAQQYGNFPTLDYELASARFQSGFYREAAEGLRKNFTVKDGAVKTNLGGRVPTEAKNFVELLSPERRASIFQPNSANSVEIADQIKSLLNFYQTLETALNDDALTAQAADEFIRGGDQTKLHRQLFVANRLLEKKANLPKILELTKAATGGVDTALNVPNPAAAVLADELYDSRKLAMSRGEIIIVPDVSRQTLSNILRGRIEDISGWALFQENKPGEAVVRLKRAVSILPEKSSWWRSSTWRLATALEADGKSSEALENYIKSYKNSEPDAVKYSFVESLYQRVNGNIDGLEAKIGAKPASFAESLPVPIEPKAETIVETKPTPSTDAKTEISTEKQIPAAIENAPPVKTETSPSPNQAEIAPPVETKPAPEISPVQPTPANVEPTPTITPTPQNTEPTPTPQIIEPTPTPTPEKPETEPIPTPMPEIKSEETAVKPAPDETKTEPKPTVSESPTEPKRSEPESSPTPVKFEPTPTSETPTVENKTAETAKNQPANDAPKSLFEPIIINVPKPIIKSSENNPQKKTIDENSSNGRPRVVVETTDATIKETPPQCTVTASEESVSVLNGGGILSVLINVEGAGDLKEIKAVSSSPNDVEVVAQPVGEDSSRGLFFNVKSISRKTGIFTVTFELPCGKKEIQVRVR